MSRRKPAGKALTEENLYALLQEFGKALAKSVEEQKAAQLAFLQALMTPPPIQARFVPLNTKDGLELVPETTKPMDVFGIVPEKREGKPLILDPTDVVEYLKWVKRRLATPRQWIKGNAFSKDRKRRCLGSALCAEAHAAGWSRDMTDQGQTLVWRAISRMASAPKSQTGSIPAFNDHPKTTHKDIIRVLNKAIRLAGGRP